MPLIKSAYIPSPRRMAVVARATLTQLVRMKVFLFLAVFCLIILLVSSIKPEYFLGSETFGANGLTLLKNSAFGAIRLFGLVFCILATSLIIPKDTEDRILYTILSKPVHRIDYLAGKALGVIALTLIAILIMTAFSSMLLWLRTDSLIEMQKSALLSSGYSLQDIQPYLDGIKNAGVTWNLHAGVFVLFMECIVLTSMTLLLSCITGGTIISALLSFCIYFVGIFQAQAKAIWIGSAGEGTTRMDALAGQLFSLFFPNYGIYSISDSAINGIIIPSSILWQIALITLAYFIFHIGLSSWIFRKKEF